MKRHIAAVAGLGLLTPAALLGQRFEASVAAQVITHRAVIGGPIQEGGATFQGASVALRFGALRIGAEGLVGTVKPSVDRAFTVRATTLAAGVRAGAVEFGIEGLARHRKTSDNTTSLARLIGPYGTVTTGFGGGLSGTATVAWYLVRSTVNSEPLTVAGRAEVGARFSLAHTPLSVFTSYRVTRLDYRATSAGTARLEQDAGAMFGVTFRSR